MSNFNIDVRFKIDEKVKNETYESVRDSRTKSNDLLSEKHAEMKKVLKEGTKEGKEEFSFANITSYSGTDEEKMRQFAKSNSELSGAKQAVGEWMDLDHDAALIEKGIKTRMTEEYEKLQSDASRSDVVSEISNEQKDFGTAMAEGFQKQYDMSISEAAQRGGQFMFDLSEVKMADFTTTSGALFRPRKPGLVLTPDNDVVLMDILPRFLNSSNSKTFEYHKEKTKNGGAAATIAEGGTYPEASFDYEAITVNLEKKGAILPITDEMMESDAALVAFVTTKLAREVEEKIENFAMGDLVGETGVAEVALGHASDVKNAAVKVWERMYDAILDHIFLNGAANANITLMHPTLFNKANQEQINSGFVLGGNASTDFVYNVAGTRVILNRNLSVAANGNAAVVGAFDSRYIELAVGRNMNVQTGYNNDDFATGKQSIRADAIVKLVVYRPSSFAKLAVKAM